MINCVDRIKDAVHSDLWAYAFSRVSRIDDPAGISGSDLINTWTDETADKIVACYYSAMVLDPDGLFRVDQFEVQVHQLMWLRCGMIDGEISKFPTLPKMNKELTMHAISELVHEIVVHIKRSMKGTWVT